MKDTILSPFRIVYKYFRHVETNAPIITQCKIIKLNTEAWNEGYKVVGRGYAICSPKDNPNKTIGRQIAFRRAIRGFRANITSCPVHREEALRVCEQAALSLMYKSNNN